MSIFARKITTIISHQLNNRKRDQVSLASSGFELHLKLSRTEAYVSLISQPESLYTSGKIRVLEHLGHRINKTNGYRFTLIIRYVII